jgi:hypothetical protein
VLLLRVADAALALYFKTKPQRFDALPSRALLDPMRKANFIHLYIVMTAAIAIAAVLQADRPPYLRWLHLNKICCWLGSLRLVFRSLRRRDDGHPRLRLVLDEYGIPFWAQTSGYLDGPNHWPTQAASVHAGQQRLRPPYGGVIMMPIKVFRDQDPLSRHSGKISVS